MFNVTGVSKDALLAVTFVEKFPLYTLIGLLSPYLLVMSVAPSTIKYFLYGT